MPKSGNSALWYIHNTVKYYSLIKRNKLLKHVTTWMNLRGVILSERIQSQKVRYDMTSVTVLKIKSIVRENKSVVARS